MNAIFGTQHQDDEARDKKGGGGENWHRRWEKRQGENKTQPCPDCAGDILDVAAMSTIEALDRLKASGETFPLRGQFFRTENLLLYHYCNLWRRLRWRLCLAVANVLFDFQHRPDWPEIKRFCAAEQACCAQFKNKTRLNVK